MSLRRLCETTLDREYRQIGTLYADIRCSAIYHRDRLYTKEPPAGVSTGLGYLGNGSGAVMPIEVTVRLLYHIAATCTDHGYHSQCLARAVYS